MSIRTCPLSVSPRRYSRPVAAASRNAADVPAELASRLLINGLFRPTPLLLTRVLSPHHTHPTLLILEQSFRPVNESSAVPLPFPLPFPLSSIKFLLSYPRGQQSTGGSSGVSNVHEWRSRALSVQRSTLAGAGRGLLAVIFSNETKTPGTDAVVCLLSLFYSDASADGVEERQMRQVECLGRSCFSITCSTLSLARSAQAERDNES
ncbi:hypothetical protein EVAR_12908_1 [Eumeta japonica]|uniref:Uncharacterized protein n=1 Tax=Eumeta variegata TaxID=151549 RepID=A0A4C1TVT5_EUMVA|nr:hypothetical protein EVAR_12908_1 [Eumeta japonica]